ncbi:MAG: tetratricopeptide repeat protein [Firmicutes bacterium]|nr:tetratricopeptide repeat protein [Bacillota bacterium]
MDKKEIITNLKRSLEHIYINFRSRTDPKEWKNIISSAYKEQPFHTAIAVINFVQKHHLMPRSVWQAICNSIDLRNNPAEMSEIFSQHVINKLFYNMVNPDPIRYAYISPDKSDDDIKTILDLAENALFHMEKGQIYLAGKYVRELKEYCPTHPDVLEMQSLYSELRVSGGVYTDEFRKGGKAVRNSVDERTDIGVQFIKERKYKEAVEFYEDSVKNNYGGYSDYYTLGSLYLQINDLKKADTIADFFLDINKEPSYANILKGMVLEAKNRFDDALFYYNKGFELSRSQTAKNMRDRLADFLEYERKEKNKGQENKPNGRDIGRIPAVKAASGAEPESRNKVYELPAFELSEALKVLYDAYRLEEQVNSVPAISEKILSIADNIEESVKKGRFSQAYYELRRKAASYPDSSLLKFKKAFVLYLMERELEARVLLVEIKESDYLYERCQYMIEDIDYNIAENGRFDGIPDITLAEILFNAGNYNEALNVFAAADTSKMNAKAWSIRGRCELNENHINDAFSSLSRAYRADINYSRVRDLIGMIFQVKGDYAGALRMYNEAIAAEEDPLKACEMKAALLYYNGKTNELLKFRNDAEAILNKGSDVDGYAGLVYLSDDRKNTEKGILCIEKALNSGSDRAEFYKAAIDAYMETENYTRALMYAEAGISITDGLDEFYIRKAEILYFSGKINAADIVANMILNQYPDSAEIQYLIGMINSSRGKDREAVKWLHSAANMNQQNHKYASALADKCFETGDMVAAVKYYTKAIELDKMDYISYKRRAVIHSRINEDETALEDINRAMLLNPDDPEIYVIIGNILSGYESQESDEMSVPKEVSAGSENQEENESSDSADEKDEETGENIEHEKHVRIFTAEEIKRYETSDLEFTHELERDSEYYYTKALTLAPEYREGYICRAKFYAEKNRIKAALADIEKAISLNKDENDSYMVRGIIYHIAGDNDKAIMDFEKVLSIDGSNLQAYSYIAKCCNELGRYEEAIDIAEEGLTVDPEFFNLYVNRGVAYFNLLKYNQAIEDFRRIIMKKNAVNTAAVESAYKFRGLTYEKMNRYVEAISDYRMFLKYNPDNEEVKARLKNLESYLEPEKTKTRSKFTLFRRSSK